MTVLTGTRVVELAGDGGALAGTGGRVAAAQPEVHLPAGGQIAPRQPLAVEIELDADLLRGVEGAEPPFRILRVYTGTTGIAGR